MRKGLVVGVVAQLLGICLAAIAPAQERVALVIGNSEYEHVGSLNNPKNDALDIAVALEGQGFTTVLGKDLTKAKMTEAASQLAKLAENADVVLFYYAGHGFQADGQNYLVPTDAAIRNASDVTSQTTSLNEILVAMQSSDGLKLLFLDACRDNPFGGLLEDEPHAGSGLARVGKEVDFLFAYATQPDNVAYDGTGRNSFFTEAVLHHLYTPGQDISDLMRSVRRDVLAATGGRQIPWENSSLTRRFVFDESPVSVSQETLFYQVAMSTSDPELLKLYLNTYPRGAHQTEARELLKVGDLTRKLDFGGTAEAEDRLTEDKLWTVARRSRSRPLLEFYVKRYPDGAHNEEARRLIPLIPAVEDFSPGALCERLATHPSDATARSPGVPFSRLRDNAFAAIRACSAAVTQSPDITHYLAMLARASAASGDMSRAIDLYEAAAGRGDLRAMVSLAQLKERGTATEKDLSGALALYEVAADGGSQDAMINLAVTLFEGELIPQDTPRAIDLLKRAAREGSAKAGYNLGVLAQDGIIDTPEAALGYFHRAAIDGESQGYRAAAILLDEGRGVEQDPADAAVMILRGVAEDDGSALAHLAERTSEWSTATIVEVQQRLADAGLYTSTVNGLPGPNFTSALTDWRNGGFDAAVLAD